MVESIISEIENLFQEWNKALQTGDPDFVTSLYADDAVLLPTLSPVVRSSHKMIKDYFSFFLQFKPCATLLEHHIRHYGDTAINSGIYVFTLIKGGKVETLPVRFTFVYHETPDGLKIAEHHSSALPVSKN